MGISVEQVEYISQHHQDESVRDMAIQLLRAWEHEDKLISLVYVLTPSRSVARRLILTTIDGAKQDTE
jgi:hypothetical protein